MTEVKRIAVFCSASYTIEPKFNISAREFVRRASESGYEIVSGGTVKGTMGEIADELASCGGLHHGVLPCFMQGLVHPGLTEVTFTDTMSQRKELMRKDTYAVVALAGGVGTLDELIETLTLKKLKQYGGKILVLNQDGFYNPLKDLLDYYVKTEMLDEESRQMIEFADSVDALMDLL